MWWYKPLESEGGSGQPWQHQTLSQNKTIKTQPANQLTNQNTQNKETETFLGLGRSRSEKFSRLKRQVKSSANGDGLGLWAIQRVCLTPQQEVLGLLPSGT